MANQLLSAESVAKLKERLAPYQQTVQKNYLVSFLSTQGKIQHARLTSSTIPRLNKLDFNNGKGMGKYFNAQCTETKEIFTLNFGESSKNEFIWVAYKSNDPNPPSLEAIIAECEAEYLQDSSVSQVFVHIDPSEDNDDNNAVPMDIDFSPLTKQKKLISYVDFKMLSSLQLTANMIIEKTQNILAAFKNGDISPDKLKELEQEKITFINNMVTLKKETEYNNKDNDQDTVKSILKVFTNAVGKFRIVLKPMEDEINEIYPISNVLHQDSQNPGVPEPGSNSATVRTDATTPAEKSMTSSVPHQHKEVQESDLPQPKKRGLTVRFDASTPVDKPPTPILSQSNQEDDIEETPIVTQGQWRIIAYDYKEQVSKLTDEVRRMSSDVTRIREDAIQKVQTQKDNSKQIIDAQEENIQDLRALIAHMKKNHPVDNSIAVNYQDTLEENDGLKRAMDNLRNQTDEQLKDIREAMEDMKKQHEAELGSARNSLKHLQVANDLQANLLEGRDNEMKDLQAQLKEAKSSQGSTLDALEGALDRAENEIQSIKTTKDREIDTLRGECLVQQGLLESYEKDAKRMKTMFEEMQKEIETITDQESSLRSKLDQTASSQADVTRLTAALERSNDLIVKQQAEIRNLNALVKDRTSVVSDRITQLNTNIDNLGNSVSAGADNTIQLNNTLPTNPDPSMQMENTQVRINSQRRAKSAELAAKLRHSASLRLAISNGYALDNDQIEALSSERIRKLIDENCSEVMCKKLEQIASTVLELQLFESSNMDLLTAEEFEDIENELADLDALRQKFNTTKAAILAVAERKNIKDKKDSKFTEFPAKDSIKEFSGSCQPYHYYEFITVIENYMRDQGVQVEDGGRLLLSLVTDNAKHVLTDAFPYEINPDFEQAKSVLQDNFGDRDNIFSQLIHEHNTIGEIPEYIHPSEAESVYALVQQHNKLITRAQMIRNPHDDQPNTIDNYTKAIVNLLPTKQRMSFWDCDTGYTSESMFQRAAQSFRAFKRGTQNMVTKGFKAEINQVQIKQNMSQSFVSSSQERLSDQLRVEEVETKNCPLCDFLSGYELTPDLSRHVIVNKTNRVLPDLCPHIATLTLEEKFEFLNDFGFCKKCLNFPISSEHSQELCEFTKKAEKYKCSKPECFLRFTTCKDHKLANKRRLLKMYYSIRTIEGVDFKFE